jgi:hypothetical protein
VIAVDTNILVYAHRVEAPKHRLALARLEKLAGGGVPFGIPVFCLGEFVRVVTHRRVFDPPSTLEQALGALRALLISPSARILNPGDDFFQNLTAAAHEARATGNLAFDAQIVAVCREHGVGTILSEDRDFQRFTRFQVVGLDDPEGQ